MEGCEEMKYITVVQFFRAKFEVRKEILNWWKPEIGDLAESTNGGVKCLTKRSEIDFAKSSLENKDKYSIIPLLTTQQLIDFIEYKLKDEVDIYRAGMKGHQISTEWIDGVGRSKFEFKTDTHDLLLALWECAQEVCR